MRCPLRACSARSTFTAAGRPRLDVARLEDAPHRALAEHALEPVLAEDVARLLSLGLVHQQQRRLLSPSLVGSSWVRGCASSSARATSVGEANPPSSSLELTPGEHPGQPSDVLGTGLPHEPAQRGHVPPPVERPVRIGEPRADQLRGEPGEATHQEHLRGGQRLDRDAACPELLEHAAQRQEQQRQLVRGERPGPPHVRGEVLPVQVLAHHVGSTVVETTRPGAAGPGGGARPGRGRLARCWKAPRATSSFQRVPWKTRTIARPPLVRARARQAVPDGPSSSLVNSWYPKSLVIRAAACLPTLVHAGEALRSGLGRIWPATPPFCAPGGSRSPGWLSVWLLFSHLVLGACPAAPAVLSGLPTMAENFIFTMQDLRKVRGGKDILKGIYLSFFPGAKIGVIGPNGAGKSTLLRIMAGQDTEFFGTARPDPTHPRRATSPRSRSSTPSLDVKGNVELGGEAAPRRAGPVQRGLEPARRAHGRRRRWRSSSPSRPSSRTPSTPRNGWELDRTLEVAMDALRLPPGRRAGGAALGRREAPGGAVPDPPGEAGPAPARRAHQPPGRRERGLARARAPGVPGHRGQHHPRPVLPRQRGRSGSSSWTAARACPGRATTPAGWSRSRSGWQMEEKQESARQKQLQARAGVGALEPAGAAGQEQGPPRGVRGAASTQAPEKRDTTGEIYHPARARSSAVWWSRRRGLRKAYGDRLLIDDLNFKLPPGGIVGRHRAERRGQDHALPDDHRPGEARRRRAARSATR